jgi:hypothetical protein
MEYNIPVQELQRIHAKTPFNVGAFLLKLGIVRVFNGIENEVVKLCSMTCMAHTFDLAEFTVMQYLLQLDIAFWGAHGLLHTQHFYWFVNEP